MVDRKIQDVPELPSCGHKMRFACSWDDAAAILCDSEILTVNDFGGFQSFNCTHPRLGMIEVILGVAQGGVIMGNITPDMMYTLMITGAIAGQKLVSQHLFTPVMRTAANVINLADRR